MITMGTLIGFGLGFAMALGTTVFVWWNTRRQMIADGTWNKV